MGWREAAEKFSRSSLQTVLSGILVLMNTERTVVMEFAGAKLGDIVNPEEDWSS